MDHLVQSKFERFENIWNHKIMQAQCYTLFIFMHCEYDWLHIQMGTNDVVPVGTPDTPSIYRHTCKS